MLRFEVPGPVRGKGRPRFVRATGHVYTPAETENYEAWIKANAKAAMKPGDMLVGPVGIYLDVAFEIPSSWSKKKRARAMIGELSPVKKPDIDNIVKIVTDALNGMAYFDDKQICNCTVVKHYAPEPRLLVEVWQDGPESNGNMARKSPQ